ncbi:MAG: UvrD-helicase domain-containing protein [Burkholderiales bacterium]|nr:UvrD-helicase domain-containing protein [Burkholderiales bacterium]
MNAPAFLAQLNPEQLAAVTLPRESALILAGAGSGKTRVLTTRIAWLIQTGQASPGHILAVTFTNKAAREMLTRLSSMLPINTRGMWVGTFHGLANRLLRAHHREAGLPQLFQILDQQDQLAAIKRVLKAANVDDERYPPRQVQYFINSAKEQGLRAGEVEAPDDERGVYRSLFAAYEEQCQREGVVDFAELLLRSYELLARNEVLRAHYQARFRYILVDEFQDTSRFQYEWLKLFAGADNAVFAVGDDDQSIYAFRGAHAGNMQDFLRDFRVRQLIKLEQNYRSQGNILDAANAVIAHNGNRLGKNLWTAKGAGEPIRVFAAASDAEEAQFVVEEVRALHRAGLPLSEIAVLYRANAQSRVLEHALFSAGLPYRVYGGLRFFERQEIKHALSYLRLLANPGDDNALIRVINFPPRGIGARTLEKIQEAAREQGVSLWQAACRQGATPTRGLPAFVSLVEALREETKGMRLREQVEHMLEASGLTAHYRASGEPDRVENLEELIHAAAAFEAEYEAEAEAGVDVLIAFLTHAALEAGEHQAGLGQDALQLMTVHAAKGLEFDAVFITGLEEGLFPHENSLFEAGGVEEERRLMYVAITRARQRLYLSHAQSRMLHGQTRYGIASRFLDEIPAALLAPVGSPAPPAPRPEAAGIPWRVGQSVVHAKFGVGVIVDCEGRGADARIQVNFRDAGLKWLMVEYAKLTPA